MALDQQLEALRQILREFVADHQELASRPQGVLEILKDIETITMFLTWCVTKRYLAEVPGEAVLIALAHLQWAEKQDAILHAWEVEHPEAANTAYKPGSPEAIEQMITSFQWKITKGYIDLQSGTRVGIVNLLSGLSSARLVCHTRRMNTPSITRYKNHRFPVEIISHAVWLYFRFCLSYRAVEELLFARGVIVTYEAIRKWCRKFGQADANQLRRRRPRPGDKWHLDEVFLTIHGERHYLWRAVDQEGHVLDILVQRRRDKHAAKKFFRKLLKGCRYVPRVLITDKLKSYGAAKREILPGVEHRQHRYLNNRAENSHQPTRQRERRMQGFKSPGHAQRFLSASGPIAHHFRPRRHRLSAPEYRQEMSQRFDSWRQITSLPTAA
jgi:putative transposase